ncbi:MAG: TonB-dependent siderophore receptor [Pseudomonadota bacterium]
MSYLSFASAAAVVVASSAFAHEAPAASDPILKVDDRIVVEGEYRPRETSTAMKTPTLLIDIPQSLSIFSREQIDDQALRDIGDVLRYTPGASIGQGEGHRDQITIRGQNTTADFFIDGVRDDVQYFRPLYNLERIEILRGANALIFGRGGGGGVINRVTKTPDTDAGFETLTAGGDTFGAASAAIDLNQPLNDGTAVRLNAFYERLDNHRDEFEGDRFAVNPTFSTELTPSTTLLLSYEFVYDDRVVDRGVPSQNGRPLEGFDETFFGDPDANRTDLAAHIARARIDHDFNDAWSVNGTVQYADYDKLYQNLFPVASDVAGGFVTLDGYRDATDRQNLIVQTNLIGEVATGLATHTLLFGVEYGDQQTENSRRDVLFEDSADDQITFAFTDPLAIPAFSFPVFNRDRDSDVEFFSAYAQDQIALGERVILVGGVRYDRFEIDVTDRIAAAAGGDGLLARTDERLSPRGGIILKPLANLSFYGSYSQSFLPRSGDQFLTLSPSSEALEPEKFENLEAGVKWDVAQGLSVTAAVFRLERDSGTTVDPNDPDSTILISSQTDGIELQIAGEITPRWSVVGGYSYLDAREDGRVVGGVSANRTLGQVPEHMVSLWNRVEATEKLGFGLGVTHQAAQFASISGAVELPAFTRLDAAVYYDVTDTVSVQANIENLTNTDYFPAAHNDNNISTGEPLNARFTVTGRF